MLKHVHLAVHTLPKSTHSLHKSLQERFSQHLIHTHTHTRTVDTKCMKMQLYQNSKLYHSALGWCVIGHCTVKICIFFSVQKIVWAFHMSLRKKHARLISQASFSIKIKEACLTDDKRRRGRLKERIAHPCKQPWWRPTALSLRNPQKRRGKTKKNDGAIFWLRSCLSKIFGAEQKQDVFHLSLRFMPLKNVEVESE